MEEEKSNIIKAITTPLGFFALALLIVEGFMGIVLVFSKEQNEYFYFLGMIIGAVLFILVVVLVWYLVRYNPEKIVKSGKDYVEEYKAKLRIDNKTASFKKSQKNTTKNEKLFNYFDELTQEEIEQAKDDALISMEIKNER